MLASTDAHPRCRHSTSGPSAYVFSIHSPSIADLGMRKLAHTAAEDLFELINHASRRRLRTYSPTHLRMQYHRRLQASRLSFISPQSSYHQHPMSGSKFRTRPHTPAGGEPDRFRQRLRRWRRPAWLGTLRRLTPLSDQWGFDRGTPVDRYYIEKFLEEQRAHIRGRVLEIRDSTYTDRFGIGVETRDVLDIDSGNPRATIVADLSAADHVPADSFDCILLTQTLQFVFDLRSAIGHTRRILKPGGVVLVTVPATSRIAPRYGLTSDFWRLTPASSNCLFGEVFGAENVLVRPYGNVLTSIAFLSGLACEELRQNELDVQDDYFPLIVAIRASKSVTTP